MGFELPFVVRRLFWVVLVCVSTVSCDSSIQPRIPQIRPVDGGWISSAFGLREQHPVHGFLPGRVHDGCDFAVPEGTPVRAAATGIVRQVGTISGYGRVVLLEHDGGYASLYGHLREWRVKPGDILTAGDWIASVGQTGLTTGPHLHYELWKDGQPIDPGNFGAFQPPHSELERPGREVATLGKERSAALPPLRLTFLPMPDRPARIPD